MCHEDSRATRVGGSKIQSIVYTVKIELVKVVNQSSIASNAIPEPAKAITGLSACPVASPVYGVTVDCAPPPIMLLVADGPESKPLLM